MLEKTPLDSTHIYTPLGWISLFANDKALQKISFLNGKKYEEATTSNQILEEAKQQLKGYFQGILTEFDLPLQPAGTSFQQEVWRELRSVPHGHTISYGELANRLGDYKKVRAVGKANGKNPIPIIIPCHRVIGANNNLVGYSGGIEYKEWLLRHENALLL